MIVPMGRSIKIVRRHQNFYILTVLKYLQSIIKKTCVVRFQVNDAAPPNQGPIHIQKPGSCKPFFLITLSRAWIWEGDPQFIYFLLIKEVIQHLDLAS